MSGQKGLSPKKSAKIAKALKLPAWQATHFCDLIIKSHSRSPREKRQAIERIDGRKLERKLQNLKSEVAKALTSWLDLALLEATHLKDFQPSEEWVAIKLRNAGAKFYDHHVARLPSVTSVRVF